MLCLRVVTGQLASGGLLVRQSSFKAVLVSTRVLVHKVYIRSTLRRFRVGSLRAGCLDGRDPWRVLFLWNQPRTRLTIKINKKRHMGNMLSYLLEYVIIFIGICHTIFIGICCIYWNMLSYLLEYVIIYWNMASYLLEYVTIFIEICYLIYWNMSPYLLEYAIIFIGICYHIYWNIRYHIYCNMSSYLFIVK